MARGSNRRRRVPSISSPPRSESAPKYSNSPSNAQQRNPKAMLARGLGTSYKGQRQGAYGSLVGRGAVHHSPRGDSSWSGTPNEQASYRRGENRLQRAAKNKLARRRHGD